MTDTSLRASPPSMLTDPRRSLVLVGCLAVATAIVFALVWIPTTLRAVQRVDDTFLDLMQALRWGPLTGFMKAVSFVGSVWVGWTVRIAALAVLAWRRHWLHLAALGLAIVTSEALIGTTKALYDRPRPPGSLIATTGASFPSGHAIAAAVTAVGLVIVLLPPGHERWVWERRAALFASLMALSRIYLGAHWLSDVVAGALLGSTIAIGWPALLATVRLHRRTPLGTAPP
jgi:membrane-associated phospholipid phosphatase